MGWRSERRQRARDRRRENELRAIMNLDQEQYRDANMSAELYEIHMRQQRRGMEAKVRREFQVEILRFVLILGCAVFIVWDFASKIPAFGLVRPPSWPWVIVCAVILEYAFTIIRARRS